MLLLKNMSTIEHVEKRDPTKKDQVNPFDLGKEKNWVQVKKNENENQESLRPGPREELGAGAVC